MVEEGCQNTRRLCEICIDDHSGHRTASLNIDSENSEIKNLKINSKNSQQSRTTINNHLQNILTKCCSMFKTFEKFRERCYTNHLFPMTELINNSFKEDGHIMGITKIMEGNLTKDELNIMAKAIRCFEREHLRNTLILEQSAKIMDECLNMVMEQSFGVISNQLGKVEIAINKHSLFEVTDYSEIVKKAKEKMEEEARKKRQIIRLRQQEQKALKMRLREQEQAATLRMKFLQQSPINSRIIKDFQLIRQFFTQQTGFFSFFNKKKQQQKTRASEYNFQVDKFHKKCDGIPNTLVLVHTQFDKIIGGYTPLTWNSPKFCSSKSDTKQKSFLFSLTNQEKYTLLNKEYTIWCSSNDGPVFGGGGGHDLYIYDQGQCSATFPYNYNNGKYKLSPESIQAFSGATDRYAFKIKEWQVFEVQLI